MQPYKIADAAIKQINKYALRRADKAKQKLIVLGFDELNVLNQTDALYADLDAYTRKKYIELFIARYLEMLAYLEVKAPDDDTVDELAEIHIARLLDEPNDTTHYTYSTEILRKRDRAKEAILSVPTKAQKQLMLDKHLRYYLQSAGWYADFTSQDAEIAALKDAGVERVHRHEKNDEKTCAACRAADGEIYDIDKIPPSHPHCRRWFTPA